MHGLMPKNKNNVKCCSSCHARKAYRKKIILESLSIIYHEINLEAGDDHANFP
jgi:hypothetical protein